MKPRPPRPARRPSSAPRTLGDAPANPATLPAWKAFLVQFSRESRGTGDVFAGRIEHLSSGRRARFATTQELVAALARMLEVIEDHEKGSR